jgi:ribosomal protein S18 acetylase RimI-like enzyme
VDGSIVDGGVGGGVVVAACYQCPVADVETGTSPLDRPVWTSLAGAHADLAETAPGAARYQPDVTPFGALAPEALTHDPGGGWAALYGLVGPGGHVGVPGEIPEPPDGWTMLEVIRGVQLVATDALVAEPDAEAVRLGDADVPEMLDLTARTKPGPFLPRTHLLGTYLGIRRGGKLAAMAGERMHPPGWTEISAVCTDPGHRGQGLGTRLVRAVAAGIRARGETPFMHAAADNVNAIRLYEALGFERRRYIDFHILRAPQ